MNAKRPLPPVYLLVAMVLMVALHFLLPHGPVIPFPWNLLGAALLFLGILLNVLAARAFRARRTTIMPFDVSRALLTDGVFRISRNPMYLGMVLILAGLAALLGTPAPWAVIPVFAVAIDRLFIRVEERMLEGKFGDAWRAYRARTRRWI